MTPKYPEITVELIGHDGNAFTVLGRCRKTAREAGQAIMTISCKPPCAGSIFAEDFTAHGPAGYLDPGFSSAHAPTPSLSATSSKPGSAA